MRQPTPEISHPGSGHKALHYPHILALNFPACLHALPRVGTALQCTAFGLTTYARIVIRLGTGSGGGGVYHPS